MTLSLEQALDLALRTWAIGSLVHQQEEMDQQAESRTTGKQIRLSTARFKCRRSDGACAWHR